MHSLDNEVQVTVFEPVPMVEASKLVGTLAVVEHIAGPHERTNRNRLLFVILHEVPQAFRLVEVG